MSERLSDERLAQHAFDKYMCNVSEEQRSIAAELVEARKQLAELRAASVVHGSLPGGPYELPLPVAFESACKQLSELQAEHDKVLDYARAAKGSRDVHSVYEVLDLVAELRKDKERLLAILQDALSIFRPHPHNRGQYLILTADIERLKRRVAAAMKGPQ